MVFFLVICMFFIWSTTTVVLGCRNFDGDAIESVLTLPPFETSASEIEATVDLILDASNTELSKMTVVNLEEDLVADFDETSIAANERLGTLLGRTLMRLHFLGQTSTEEEVRDAANSAELVLESWALENLDMNYDLYQIFVAYQNTSVAASLTGERRRLLDETITGYERGGMALSKSERDQLSLWSQQLSNLTSKIESNINTDDGLVEFTPKDLEGISEERLEALQYNNVTNKYAVRTRIASEYSMVMSYASDNKCRLEALTANYQRSMETNADLIHEVIILRQQIAELLGFSTYADYATVDKLIGNSEKAYQFLTDIDKRADEKFELEQRQLKELKQQQQQHSENKNYQHSTTDLKREDTGYLMNIILENDYQIDHNFISHYFEEKATIRGLFDIYETLFGIKIDVEDVDVSWADDDTIQLARISSSSDHDDDSVIGAVYLDLHPRDGKFGHFAMFPLVQGRLRADNKYQAPIAAIVGNFPTATADRPSLWRFANVRTMFHEFGHALHHVLSCAKFSSFAGTNVPRDFVEAPSQMLERWLDDIDVVRQLSQHYETGEDLPDDILENMAASSNVFTGHGLKGQISLAMADLDIHTYTSINDIPVDGYGIYKVTNDDIGIKYPVPEHTAFLASFGHIFSGYSAGYYGYPYAGAIAADLASVFRKSDKGFMDKELGALYRKEILETGGSRDINESIQAFLGRDWNTDAFFEEALSSEQLLPSSYSAGQKDPHSHFLRSRRNL